MDRDRSVIHAVHAQDLEGFLAKLGLLEDFDSRKIRCESCGIIMTKDNLAFIFPSDGKVRFRCSSPSCTPGK